MMMIEKGKQKTEARCVRVVFVCVCTLVHVVDSMAMESGWAAGWQKVSSREGGLIREKHKIGKSID